MKSLKRMISAVLAAAMTLTAASVGFVTSLADTPSRILEAEALPGAPENIRTVGQDRIYANSEGVGGTLAYIPSTPMTFKQGRATLVVYMRLTEQPADPNQVLLTAKLTDWGTNNIDFSGVTANMIASIGKFQPVAMTVDVPADMGAQICLNYNGNVKGLEIDKVAVFNGGEIYENIEVENAPGKVVVLADPGAPAEVKEIGLQDEGVLIKSGGYSQFKALDTYFNMDIPAGKNLKVVVYIRALGSTDATVAAVEILELAKGGSAYTQYAPATMISGSQLPENGRVYAIEVPYNPTNNIASASVGIWAGIGNNQPVPFEIDRIELVEADFESCDVIRPTSFVYEAELTTCVSGTRDVADNGKAIEIDPAKHKSDFFVAGSQLSLDPGTYKISAVMSIANRSSDPNHIFAVFDTYGDYPYGAVADTVNAVRTVQFDELNTYQNIDFYYQTDTKVNNLQLRMTTWTSYTSVSKSEVKFKIDKFIIEKLPEDAPFVFEAENIPFSQTGTMTNEGLSLKANAPGIATAGTYITMAPGKYEVKIKARQKSAITMPTEIVFSFGLSYALNGTNYEKQFNVDFKGSVFTAGENNWQEFTVPFEVFEGERYMNTQLFLSYGGVCDLEIDKFSIVKTGEAIVRPKGPLFQVEAEDMQRLTGLAVGSGVVAIRGMGSTALLFGTDFTLPQGDWDVVVYAKLLSKSGGGDTLAAQFDFVPGGEDTAIMFLTDIKESQFPELDTYYPIVIPIQTLKDYQHCQLRIQYPNILDIMVDKMIVVEHGDEIPPAVQDEESDYTRPDGIDPVDSYEVPITPENIVMSSTDTGKVIDGSVVFDAAEHVNGHIQRFNTPVYLTEGEKIARVYLRTPKQVVGSIDSGYTFVEIMLLENGRPVSIKRMTAVDFYSYTNKPFVFDIPFTANENHAMSVLVKWNGSSSICVDKILFKENKDADIEVHELAMTQKDGADFISVTTDTIKDFDTIDTISMKTGSGAIMNMPVAFFKEWLKENKAVDITVGAGLEADNQKLEQYVTSFDADVTDLDNFNLSIVLRGETAEDDYTIKEMAQLIDFLVPVGDHEIKDKTNGVAFVAPVEGRVFAPVTLLGQEKEYVSFSSGRMGTYYVGLLDNVQQFNPNPTPDPTPNPGTEPGSVDTGVHFPLLATLALSSLGVFGITVSKKRKSKA